jgi:hypothetical protein
MKAIKFRRARRGHREGKEFRSQDSVFNETKEMPKKFKKPSIQSWK